MVPLGHHTHHTQAGLRLRLSGPAGPWPRLNRCWDSATVSTRPRPRRRRGCCALRLICVASYLNLNSVPAGGAPPLQHNVGPAMNEFKGRGWDGTGQGRAVRGGAGTGQGRAGPGRAGQGRAGLGRGGAGAGAGRGTTGVYGSGGFVFPPHSLSLQTFIRILKQVTPDQASHLDGLIY